MPEMNAVSRFFVNLSATRRAARVSEWIRSAVPLPKAAQCLELGCGSGTLAVRLVDAFEPARYVATDFDPRQVDEARRRVARHYRGRPPASLELRPADMLALPDGEESFDVVLAMVALHHASPTHGDFSRVPQALSEVRRVLRPGGLLVYEEFLHKEPIRQWLTGHGFSVEQVRPRWRLESVVARKLAGPPAGTTPPSGSPGG